MGTGVLVYLMTISGDPAACVRHDIELANSDDEPTQKDLDYLDYAPEVALLKGYGLHKPDEAVLATEGTAENVLKGYEKMTARYSPETVRFPAKAILPLLRSDLPDGDNLAGAVWIDRVVVKKFGELTDYDAQANGGDSARELKDALNQIYKKHRPHGIRHSELVSLYEIRQVFGAGWAKDYFDRNPVGGP